MMTLPVTGVPDSHRGSVFFLVRPDGQRGPTALACFFVGFSTGFVTSVMVSVASAEFWSSWTFGPWGPETPKGGAPSPPLLATPPPDFGSIFPRVRKWCKKYAKNGGARRHYFCAIDEKLGGRGSKRPLPG